ncbi:adenylosuccinate lyase [Candidatus Acetothermia bacterium]|nr:adenylosuccinate lyase [Candidatus Acetothermia bacterium]MBI3642820.1 adenylosuccinate lyase [Candidatus Acetothermia bacterium]
MIERYSRSPMRELWTEEAKYERWFQVEMTVVDALERLGEIPPVAAKEIRKEAKLNPERIAEIEEKIGHDLLSFVRQLEESVGPSGRYIHKGLTSYDVVDTALSMAMRDALNIIATELKTLSSTVKKRALEHKNTLMIGRTHGMQAEPITFGLMLLIWHAELERDLERIESAREVISVGKISGSVGTYANVDPKIEEAVCKKLGLKAASVSNQILQRDRHAQVLTTLAIVAGTLEKMAINIRHLHRSEVSEVREGKTHGSSSMPHKQNPSTSETIAGLVRIVRVNSLAALENMPVWNEQDLSRSSVERIIIPDSFLALHYMIVKMNEVIENLHVNVERMRENVELSRGAVYSQAILLTLIDKGMPRAEAHDTIRANSVESEKSRKHLKELLAQEKKIKPYLNAEELEELFDVKYHLKNLEKIFKRFSKST